VIGNGGVCLGAGGKQFGNLRLGIRRPQQRAVILTGKPRKNNLYRGVQTDQKAAGNERRTIFRRNDHPAPSGNHRTPPTADLLTQIAL